MKRLKQIMSLSIIVSLFSANAVQAQSLQDQEIEKITNQLAELGRYLAEEFSLALTIADKNFNVIDRSRVKFLLEEQGLANDGLLDPNTVAKLGNVKGIDAIVTGSLTSTGDYIRLIIKVLDLETAALLTGTKGDLSKNPTIMQLSESGVGNTTTKTSTKKKRQTPKETPVVTPSSPLEIDNGLIAYYPFNGDAEDESKNNNNGIVNGATLTQDRFGNEESAFDFDGKDDFIEVLVDSEEFKSIGDFTLSVWINFRMFEKKHSSSSVFDRQYIFNGHAHSKTVKSGFYKDGFNLLLDWKRNNDEILMAGLRKGGFIEFITDVPSKNAWNHLTLMKRNEHVYIYVNGQLKSKEQTALNNMDMYHNLFIGTFSGNNPYQTKGKYNYSYNGKIDDIAIYNRALSDEEILQLSEDK